ncbi:hypothetical protein OJ998_10855 [Solirubrobacter taibaiensis]|nr:hypothetical protein [Solirubrobacter taibaiensis]
MSSVIQHRAALCVTVAAALAALPRCDRDLVRALTIRALGYPDGRGRRT